MNGHKRIVNQRRMNVGFSQAYKMYTSLVFCQTNGMVLHSRTSSDIAKDNDFHRGRDTNLFLACFTPTLTCVRLCIVDKYWILEIYIVLIRSKGETDDQDNQNNRRDDEYSVSYQYPIHAQYL